MENYLIEAKTVLQNLDTISTGVGLTTANIVMFMLLSTIVAMFVWYMYRKTYQWILYSRSFNISLVLMSLITSLVIMTISGNLILSLGMVGALSIVRFRTALKDPMDLVFVFWAIAVGIANGVGFYKITIIGSLFIALVMVAYTHLESPTPYNPFLCVVKVSNGAVDTVKWKINTLVKKSSIRSLHTIDDTTEIIFEVRPKKWIETEINKAIQAIEGVQSVYLISQQGDIENVG